MDLENADWESYNRKLYQARQQAIKELYESGGLSLLILMTSKVELPGELGSALGQSGLVSEGEAEFLRSELLFSESHRAQFASSYVNGRVRVAGWNWAEDMLTNKAAEWSPAQRAEFLTALPTTMRAWEWAEKFDAETEGKFWSGFYALGLSESDDCIHAAEKLIEHGRPHMAVDLLGLHIDRAGSQFSQELIAKALAGC